LSQWLLGGVKRFYAGRFRLRMLEADACFPDTFFGTMTAGTTTAATIRALLAATRESRVIEIGLHPALAANEERQATDAWHDPLAALRPRELELLASSELEELLVAQTCRLGRLTLYQS
jgi:hypothetical protein